MLELTKKMIACTACDRVFRTGDGIYVDGDAHFSNGWAPPRGWAGGSDKGHRPVLTVSLNPGHPIEGELAHLAKAGLRPVKAANEVTDDVAKAVLNYCSAHYDSRTRSKDLIYHKKVIGYVRAAAWLLRQTTLDYAFDPRRAPWREFAWITDCFKCSTRRDRGPRIPLELMRKCVDLHLRSEIGAVQPKLVIALGGAAAEALCAAGIMHVRMRHPSNGCPALDSKDHDSGFEDIAVTLGLQPDLARSAPFRRFRSEVQRDLFG